MKNEDILLLSQVLPTIDAPEMDGWFNYAVEETIQRSASKSKSIREVVKPKGKMAEYQEKLRELQIAMSEKDEYGEPMKITTDIGGGRVYDQYVIADIDDPKSEFNTKVKELEKEYEKEINSYKKKLEFLGEENKDFEPYYITPDQIPKGIGRQQMKALHLMIKPKA